MLEPGPNLGSLSLAPGWRWKGGESLESVLYSPAGCGLNCSPASRPHLVNRGNRIQSKKPCSGAKTVLVILVTFLLASAIVPTQARAQTFKVLHTFHQANGALPYAQLTRDAAGNLYGTTSEGGRGICSNYGCGTAFKLNKNGKQVWLHSFNGKNGRQPMAGLLSGSAGNLYGTTVEGGDMTCFSQGCGTVFKLDNSGKETVLHKFSGYPDGEMPEALLVKDPAGNLYGTTYLGGASGGYGTVFQLDTAGKETILHSFAGPPDGGGDGAYPYVGVIRDAAGNLYGVTAGGGAYCCGVVYKVDTTGSETLLYSFTGGSDGGGPDSALVMDKAGNLYGTTSSGGNSECGGTGCGVVFELSPQAGGDWTETTLYTFCSQTNCADGEEPGGGLVRDSAGNLYGTTYFGGTYDDGVIFKVNTAGNERVLHTFTGGADGADPAAGLIMDNAGKLYGTTELGADTKCASDRQGCGVVFELTP